MKRYAIIVGNPGPKEHFCAGVLKDMRNYKNYLLSNHGGAWPINHIFSFITPSKIELKKLLSKLDGNIDYLVFVFVGHGAYDSEIYETVMELKTGEILKESELPTNILRRLVILDCCRKPSEDNHPLREDFSERVFLSEQASRKLYAKKFIQKLLRSQTGLIKVYSCGINQEADDSSSLGGIFSYNFLKSCEGNLDLTVTEVFVNCEEKVTLQSKTKQIPEIFINRGIKEPSFPFYIASISDYIL